MRTGIKLMLFNLTTPLKDADTAAVSAGDKVLLSGTIYTARDSAHMRITDAIEKGVELPFELKGSIIYYTGPSPTKPGGIIGSAGPTTSYRMDPFTPLLLTKGLKGMIGKGQRSSAVIDSIIENKAVYFGAVGGAAALISKSIINCEIIAYEDLGPEAIRKLEVKEMPLIVVNDTAGNDLYKQGQKKFRIN